MDASDSETRVGPSSFQLGVPGGFAPGTILADRYRIIGAARPRRHGRSLSRRRPEAGPARALKFLPKAWRRTPWRRSASSPK